MPDPLSFSARDAAREIADGRLRAVALVTACLDRIAARESVVGAWHHLDRDAALAAARRCDASAPSGPLHGIPIAVKDLIDTVDMPTGYGSAIYEGHRPAADAACVALARAAGAIVLGKTVTTEFACFTAGKTANPRNPAHTPGGSSSGSAAAVADGMVPLAFGTQTAGSVIRPASFCGVVGFKPSFGVIPRAGVKPLADSLDTVGIMARDVADAAFFAAVLSDRPGLQLGEAMAAPRIAFYRTPEWREAGPDTIAALEHATARLAGAGARTVEVTGPPEHETLVEAQKIVMDYESARALSFERITRPQDLSASLRERIAIGLGHSAKTYDAARRTVTLARAALPSLFGDFDALLVPAAPGEAPKGLDRTGDPIFNRPWTILHLPCVTVPAWRGVGGLPVGVQLVGRLGDDARTLRVAAFLERVLAE